MPCVVGPTALGWWTEGSGGGGEGGGGGQVVFVLVRFKRWSSCLVKCLDTPELK